VKRRETARPAPPLRDLAEALVAYARKCGAEEAEVSVVDGYEFNVDVRKGRIETLIEAGSRSAGLRVIKDKRTAYASSSDLDMGTLRRLVRSAVRRAELGSPDEFAGLAPLSKDQMDAAALKLYDPAIAGLDSRTKIALARETERAALRDKRITNSYGATFASNEIRSVLAMTNGFVGEYEQTYCGLGVGLQAGDTDHRVEDSWSSSKRHFKDLERPEEIARKAVERTVRQLTEEDPTQNAWSSIDPNGLALGFFGCVTGRRFTRRRPSSMAGSARGSGMSVTAVDDASAGRARLLLRSDGLPSGGQWSSKGHLGLFCNYYAASSAPIDGSATAAASGRPISSSPGRRSPDISRGRKRGSSSSGRSATA
jgi:PmbA protein